MQESSYICLTWSHCYCGFILRVILFATGNIYLFTLIQCALSSGVDNFWNWFTSKERNLKILEEAKLCVQFPFKPKHCQLRRLDPSRWNYVGHDWNICSSTLTLLPPYTWYQGEKYGKIAFKSEVVRIQAREYRKSYSFSCSLPCLFDALLSSSHWVCPWMAFGIIGLLAFQMLP